MYIEIEYYLKFPQTNIQNKVSERKKSAQSEFIQMVSNLTKMLHFNCKHSNMVQFVRVHAISRTIYTVGRMLIKDAHTKWTKKVSEVNAVHKHEQSRVRIEQSERNASATVLASAFIESH